MPGRCFAEFAHDGHGRTAIAAGMEHLELRLQPGEEVRSPRVQLLYWQGTPLHGHNVLRQFLLQFQEPPRRRRARADARVQRRLGGHADGGTPTGDRRHRPHGLPYDVYWVDAGWYGTLSKPCPDVFHGDCGSTGDWRPSGWPTNCT